MSSPSARPRPRRPGPGLLTAARESVAQRGADHAIRDLREEVRSEELGLAGALHGAETATAHTRSICPYFVKPPPARLTCTATPSPSPMLYLDPCSSSRPSSFR